MKVYTEKDFKEIVTSLKNNNILAIKTDTVFGIMALMSQDNEKRINELKQSSLDKKISIIVSDKDYLKRIIDNITEEKAKLIDEKLPGKYTFIVELKDDFIKEKGFTRKDFGVRVTSNDFLQNIIKETGPLLASSCNISSLPPCKDTAEIKSQFKNTPLEIVAGEVTDNTPSTIISIIGKITVIR